MRPRTAWILVALVGLRSAAWAQVPAQRLLRTARSADYLFASDVQDARALWVNPAGLGAVIQASVHGEIVLDRMPVPGGNFALAQYTVGFNSRGFSAGYSHDGFNGVDSSNSTIRVGLSGSLPGLAVGGSLAFYNADVKQRGIDLGVRYELAPQVALAAAVRDIGKPVLRDSVIHPRGILSATGYLLQGRATVSGELVAAERPALQSGFDVTYRAGASLQSGGRLPIGGLVALDLGHNGKIDRWSVGLSIGGPDRVIGTASVLPNAISGALDRVAITGVASRQPPR